MISYSLGSLLYQRLLSVQVRLFLDLRIIDSRYGQHLSTSVTESK